MDAARRCLDARRLHYVQLDETTIRCGWDAIPRDYAIHFRTMPPLAPGVSPRLMLHGAPDVAVRLKRIPEARLLLHAINDTRLMGAWVLADDGTTNCRLGHLIPEGTPVGVGAPDGRGGLGGAPGRDATACCLRGRGSTPPGTGGPRD